MRKINYLYLLLCLVFASACDSGSGEGDAATTVAEDKQNIKAVFDNSITCVRHIRDGEFAKWITEAVKLENGDALNDEWVETLAEELDDAADLGRISDNERFTLSTFAGTYTWNRTSESWTKTANANGQMVLVFPATPGTTTNNCEFRITEYTDEAHSIDGDQVYLPKVVKASLKKDNSEIFNLNLTSSYNSSGSMVVPVNFNLSLKMNPVTYVLGIKRLTNTQFETTFALQQDSDCATTITSVLNFAHDDYENYFDDAEDLNTVQAQVEKGGVIIGGTWDVKAFNKFSDPTTEQTNSTLNLSIQRNGQKIGDLRLKDVGNDTEVHVFYKDGTSENASVYYEPFIDNLDAELKGLLGSGAISSGRKAPFSLRNVDFKSKFEKAIDTLVFWD